MEDLLEQFLMPTVVSKEPVLDYLMVMNGPEDGRMIKLDPDHWPADGTMKIGRLDDNEIVLALDLAVSRHHARLTYEAGVYSIEDWPSRYGTVVDGEPVTGRKALKNGSFIQIGETLLCLRCQS